MERLVFTIDNNMVIFNGKYRFRLSDTNLPRELASFEEGFYCSASITSINEGRGILYAKVDGYSSTIDDFALAQALPFKFSKIEFSDFDRAQLQTKPLIKEWFAGDQVSLAETETFILEVRPAALNVTGTNTNIAISINGVQKRLILCEYPQTYTLPNSHFIQYYAKETLGKDTLAITLSLQDGKVQAQSQDVIDILKIYYDAKKIFNMAIRSPEQSEDPFESSPEWSPDEPISREETTPVKTVYKWVEKSVILRLRIEDLDFGSGFILADWKGPDDHDHSIRIDNACIEPEFTHIQDCLWKAINKKSVKVFVVYQEQQDQFGKIHDIEISSATSDDIDKIDSGIVMEANKQTCIDRLFTPREDASLSSIDDCLGTTLTEKDLMSPTAIVDVICDRRKNTCHGLELKYLARKHLEKEQPLRFGRGKAINSFLFYIAGKSSNFLILETIEDKLATYVWACPESSQELQDKIEEIESLVTSLEKTIRRQYRATKPENFDYIIHRYRSGEDDFIEWQEKLQAITDL